MLMILINRGRKTIDDQAAKTWRSTTWRREDISISNRGTRTNYSHGSLGSSEFPNVLPPRSSPVAAIWSDVPFCFADRRRKHDLLSAARLPVFISPIAQRPQLKTPSSTQHGHFSYNDRTDQDPLSLNSENSALRNHTAHQEMPPSTFKILFDANPDLAGSSFENRAYTRSP